MDSFLLETKKVSKIYEEEGVSTTALKDADFAVKKGEFVAIKGQSGSGKSTLLHILGLLDRPSKGSFFFNGIDTTTLSDTELAVIRNREIGFIFQTFHLLARTSVLNNVMLPLEYSKIPRSQHKAKAMTSLERVGMSHRLDHTPGQLSGGEKQRAVIARALVTEPKLLLADEPTGNLDSKSGQVIMQFIEGLHKQGITVLVITHETITAKYAQRLISIEDGGIVSDEKLNGHRPKFFSK